MAGGTKRRANPTLLEALAMGMSTEQAAEQAGVGASTVYRRLRDPAFRLELDRLRAERLERASGALADVCMHAITTLHSLLLSAKSETVRLGAARSIVELAFRARELVSLETRIAELEAQREGR